MGSEFLNGNIAKILQSQTVLPTCASKKVHVNLLQQVDGEGVDLREKAHQEGDWEAVGKPCLMRHRKSNLSRNRTF